MDGAVGVGRAVVQDVAGRAGAGGADLAVEVGFLPGWRRSGSLTGRLAFMGKAVCGRFSVDLSGFGWGLGASGIRSSWCGWLQAARPGWACSVVRAGEFIPGQSSIVSGSAPNDGDAGTSLGQRLPGANVRQRERSLWSRRIFCRMLSGARSRARQGTKPAEDRYWIEEEEARAIREGRQRGCGRALPLRRTTCLNMGLYRRKIRTNRPQCCGLEWSLRWAKATSCSTKREYSPLCGAICGTYFSR